MVKEEEGLVIEVSGNIAKLKAGRHNECKSCGACPGGNSLVLEALNEIGAEPGQRVIYQLRENNMLLGSMIVYLLPIAAIFTGIYLGGLVSEHQTFARAAFVVAGLIISIICIRAFDNAIKRNSNMLPKIIRVTK